MGDHLTVSEACEEAFQSAKSAWDGSVYTFTKEACEEAFQAIKKNCQPLPGSIELTDPGNAFLPAFRPVELTQEATPELLADELFEKLTS